VNAVKHALTALPCVEPDSVQVSKAAKEARFVAKAGSTCDIEDVKKAIASAGSFSVTNVKPPATK